jgi:hypothetical protein
VANRVLAALAWPVLKLIDLERRSRVVWSLAATDAAALGMWLFTINSFVFQRPLDQDDYSTIIIVPVLCHALCLGYGMRPGRPWWHWLAKSLLSQVLAAAILYAVFARLPMDLSGRQVLKFLVLNVPMHLLVRVAYLGFRRAIPWAPLECVRLSLAAATGFFFFGIFFTTGSVGSGDSYWYCVMLADFVTQLRAGVFPVFVGQSEYAFNGAVIPLRFAPALQHFAGAVDLLTGRSLPFYTLQNMTLALCAFGGVFAAYFCVASILPRRRWTALVLAALYIGCPGILSLGYQGDLFMSITALPFVPLAAFGLWRTLEDESTSIAWTVLPLAALWYCHPPIALWTTLVAAGVHVTIGLRRWRDPNLYAWWGRGALLFALAAGYLFVSVKTLQVGSIATEVAVTLESIRGAFPAMLFPVSDTADRLSDYQLGWGLGAALMLAAACAIRPRRARATLVFAACVLFFLLLPIPWINEAIWRALPQVIRDITDHWPMQRFYVIMAGLVVVAAADALAKLDRSHRVWARISVVVLFVGAAWSFREGVKFIIRGEWIVFPIKQAGAQLQLNNAILTRYAFNPFDGVPPYYSHGYVDPYLENRVLGPDRSAVLASNVAAARPPDAAAQIPLSGIYDGARTESLAPKFGIAPNVRYAVRFEAHGALGSGSLLVTGTSVLREYFMPDSALGMVHRVPTDAFGLQPGSRNFFPLWTSQPGTDVVEFRYVFDVPPKNPPPADFARLYLQPYAPSGLPIKVTSWIPYRAAVAIGAPGAWLETPRLYVPGYEATINGLPAPVVRLRSGLVAVGLQPGNNDVVLRYAGPWSLRAAYWIAILTWAAVIMVIVQRWRRALTPLT